MSATAIDALPSIGPSAITLGVFDGVHLGHRHLVEATVRAATQLDVASVALVFSPHPDEVLHPGTVVPRLLPPALTFERLVAAGLDHVVEVRFDEDVRAMAPEVFLAALAPSIEVRVITMTPDSAFGRARAGTPARIAQIGARRGFDAITVGPLLVDGEAVSSSRIRDALSSGEIERATNLLGGAPVLCGLVVHGDRRGRELGFPTANLGFAYTPALPALGIYLGNVHVPGRGVGPGHPALVSIGVRPTFHDDGRVLVEVHLLDWDGDLYDATLYVEVDRRLREERRFESVEELVQQMRVDEQAARLALERRSS